MLLIRRDDGIPRIPQALCVLIIILFTRPITTEVCNATGPGNCDIGSLCSWNYSTSVWNTDNQQFRLRNNKPEGTITSQMSCATPSTNCLYFELQFENDSNVTVTVTLNANEQSVHTILWMSESLQSAWINSYGTVLIPFCSYLNFTLKIIARRSKQLKASVRIKNIEFARSQCQCKVSTQSVCPNHTDQCKTTIQDYENSGQSSYETDTGAIVGAVVAVSLALVGVIVVLILAKRKGLSVWKSCLQRQRQSEELPVTAVHSEANDLDHCAENSFQEADSLPIACPLTQSLTNRTPKTPENSYSEITTGRESVSFHDYCTIPNIHVYANKNVSIYEEPHNESESEPGAGRQTPDVGTQSVYHIPVDGSQETTDQAGPQSSTGIYHVLVPENHSTTATEQSVYHILDLNQGDMYKVLDSDPTSVGEESERGVYHLPMRQAENHHQNIPKNGRTAADQEITQVTDLNNGAGHTPSLQNPTDAVFSDSQRNQINSTEDDYNRLGMHAVGKGVQEDTAAREGVELYSHLAETDADDYNEIDRDRHTEVIDEAYSHLH